MAEENKVGSLVDLGEFELSDYDGVAITMPPAPTVSEEDIDAQLFTYVANAPKGSGIVSIADLDDAWVAETFPDLGTLAALRDSIRKSLMEEMTEALETYRYLQCADALISKLVGTLPVDLVDDRAEEVRQRNEEMFRMSGISKARYFEDEGLTKDTYEERVREEAEHDVALNIALDKLIEHEGVTVAVEEITQYLMCDDPDGFLNELEEKGLVEKAKLAAVRVKAMREVVENAEVEVASA